MVLFPAEFHCSRRLKRTLHQGLFRVTFDTDFVGVIKGCAAPRSAQRDTWIVPEMQEAYIRLHEEGWAHSVECWQGDTLVGGLYGVSLGGFFFGESMFSKVANSSKVALASLVRQLVAWDFDLLDCQMKTSHLVSLGAREINGMEFGRRLQDSLQRPTRRGSWSSVV
jgi:leucyl/phenylalanyl-tRNA--protein transferase